ncbi:hypothetical protein C0J52_18069 [Blattella germanica]|nr:hypothetical protein C0J52_18069 [Blattella germanica]
MPGRHVMGGAGGSGGGGGGGTYSESAALVRSTEGMSYTEEGRPPPGGGSGSAGGGGGTPHDGGEDELMDYVDSDVSVLAQFHEDAIRQWMLMLVSGLGLAADTIELFVIPYILPSAEVELCIDASQKTWFSGITFLGMMVGSVVWGNLSDRMGRRRTLLSALGVNAVFSVIAAFMPTYGTFMTARFCSSADRAKYLSWLLTLWALGGVLVAVIAWGILPRTAHAQYQLSELELPSKRPSGRGLSSPPSPGKSVLADMIYSIEMFWNSFLQLYYGLTIWFPEYIKLLKTRDYEARTEHLEDRSYENCSFTNPIENVRWINSSFKNCTFQNITLSHVTFESCFIEEVRFEIIKSSRTYFKNCTIKDSSSILTLSAGCSLDFDYNIHLEEVFQEHLVGQLAILPGAFFSALAIDKLGRVKIIG